jgi:hypothetical protein
MSSAPERKPVDLGVADIVAPPIPSAPAEDENLLYELEVKSAELDKARLANDAFRQDIQDRGRWGGRVFWLLVGWLLAVVGVMTLQGFGFWGFKLDKSIIITFITTTTVNVLSLGYIVANYLFPKPQ